MRHAQEPDQGECGTCRSKNRASRSHVARTNPSLVSEDTILNRADIETELHSSERLTMSLRQIPLRRGEARSKALICLILTMSEGKTPCKLRRDGEDCDGGNGKERCNEFL